MQVKNCDDSNIPNSLLPIDRHFRQQEIVFALVVELLVSVVASMSRRHWLRDGVVSDHT